MKVVKKRAEEGKIAVRGVRRDAIDYLKEMQKDGDISEDDFHRGQEEIQELTNKFTEQVDKVLESKEEEIMEI